MGTHAKNRQELYEVSKALEQAGKKQKLVVAKQGTTDLSGKQTKTSAGQSGTSIVLTSPGVSKKRKVKVDSANGHATGSVESSGVPVMYITRCRDVLCGHYNLPHSCEIVCLA